MPPSSLLRKPGTAVALPVVQKAMIEAGGMGLSFPWECGLQPFCSSQHPCQLGRGACSLPTLPSSSITNLLLTLKAASAHSTAPILLNTLLNITKCCYHHPHSHTPHAISCRNLCLTALKSHKLSHSFSKLELLLSLVLRLVP